MTPPDKHLTRRLAAAVAMSVLIGFVASGCGEANDARPAAGTPTGDEAGRPVIATLGDSIVAGSPLWDPDEETRSDLDELDRDSQWQVHVAADDVSLRNCGVWGERTDEIAARLDECTSGAEAVVIQGGINDIVQERSLDDVTRNLACMAEEARRAGLRIALVDLLPWNNGWPDAAPRVVELNRRIHALGRRAGVPVLPFYATLEDPDRPGRMPSDLTDDGNHPNVAGYRLLGQQAWREPTKARAAFTADC